MCNEVEGGWMVLDVFTGWPAEYMGRPLKGLDERTATTLCTLVNALDKHRRRLQSEQREDFSLTPAIGENTNAVPFGFVRNLLSRFVRTFIRSRGRHTAGKG
jgi:hypothetical protein